MKNSNYLSISKQKQTLFNSLQQNINSGKKKPLHYCREQRIQAKERKGEILSRPELESKATDPTLAPTKNLIKELQNPPQRKLYAGDEQGE